MERFVLLLVCHARYSGASHVLADRESFRRFLRSSLHEVRRGS